MKNKILVLGLLILTGVVLSGCSQSVSNSETATVQASVVETKPQIEKIEVVNFHATQRCASCTKLGKYSEETVYEFFQAELASGRIEFKAVNVDLPENEEIAKKYQATGSSLFINMIYDGQDHIEEEAKVWRLLSDESGFKDYLKNKINGLLGK